MLALMLENHAIYLDSNSGAPLKPQVVKALQLFLENENPLLPNPSSIHFYGRKAKRLVSDAREKLSRSISSKTSPEQILFTSSGTEANQWAIRSIFEPLFLKGEKPHWITTPVEHDSVLKMVEWIRSRGGTVDFLEVDQNGSPRIEGLDDLWKKETRLVSVLWVNNETGVISDIQAFSKKISEFNGFLHLDAAQAWGKLDLDVEKSGAHLVSFSGHKIGALNGIGALWHQAGIPLNSILLGSQESGRRGGTENLMGIVSLGAAATSILPGNSAEFTEKFQPLRDRLEHSILELIEGVKVNGQGASRVANTLSLSFSGVDGESLVLALDMEGFSVSAGSACSSGALSPSHVLLAMGRSKQEALASIRISLGGMVSWPELEKLVYSLKKVIARLRVRKD